MKVFAKALSAFSNSAGGLIVWGVEAKKGSDQVDCAQRREPIIGLALFHSRANSLVAQLIQPKHDGVSIAPIMSTSVADSGYLLVWVNRSDRRPHRSEAAGQKEYFKRMGDNSIAMEHYDIEDAFKRFSAPELSVSWKIEPLWIDGAGNKPSRLLFKIKNTSRVTAKFPYLYILDQMGNLTLDALQSYQQANDGSWYCYYAGADQVINPGTSSNIVRASIGDARSGLVENGSGVFTLNGTEIFGQVARISYRIGCENTAMKEGEISIIASDLYHHKI